jgi:hypothetical protein
MKKVIFTFVAMLAVTLTMGAQKVRFTEDADLAFGDKTFVVEPLSYLGYGYHFKTNEMDSEQNAFNNEFFINIIELGLRPFKGGMFSLGVDYDLDQYRLKKSSYWFGIEDKGVVIIPVELSTYKKIKSSCLNVHTFSVPLSFELEAGRCAFRIGAAGEFNLPAVTRGRYVGLDGSNIRNRIPNIPVNQFTYSLFGTISYGGLGIYVRYRPIYQFAEGAGPLFKTLTLGAVLGIGM